jgi:hypothetical protein
MQQAFKLADESKAIRGRVHAVVGWRFTLTHPCPRRLYARANHISGKINSTAIFITTYVEVTAKNSGFSSRPFRHVQRVTAVAGSKGRLTNQNNNNGNRKGGGCPPSDKGRIKSQPEALTTHNIRISLPQSVTGFFHRTQKAMKNAMMENTMNFTIVSDTP